MSRRDQSHPHKYKRRIRDWLVMPHSSSTRALRDVTAGELQAHATENDCWLCIDGVVYDVTRFLKHHPGGPRAIIMSAGRDATIEFQRNHTGFVAADVVGPYAVGRLSNKSHLTSVDTSQPPVAGADPPTHSHQASSSEEEQRDIDAVFDEILGGSTGVVSIDRVADFLGSLDKSITLARIEELIGMSANRTVSKEAFKTLMNAIAE